MIKGGQSRPILRAVVQTGRPETGTKTTRLLHMPRRLERSGGGKAKTSTRSNKTPNPRQAAARSRGAAAPSASGGAPSTATGRPKKGTLGRRRTLGHPVGQTRRTHGSGPKTLIHEIPPGRPKAERTVRTIGRRTGPPWQARVGWTMSSRCTGLRRQ
jgi:hypothetical protein